jgi:hypothetical protein
MPTNSMPFSPAKWAIDHNKTQADPFLNNTRTDDHKPTIPIYPRHP